MISGMEEARVFLAAKKQAEGWSTSEMARRLGMNRIYLHLILKGDRPVTLSLAKKLRPLYPELLLIIVGELTRPDEPARAEHTAARAEVS